MTKHQFTHTYADGKKVTLSVAFDDDRVSIIIDPPVVAPEHEAEYLVWRNEVLAVELLEVLPPEHRLALAVYSMKMLRDLMDREENA